MKKSILFVSAICAAFCLGYAMHPAGSSLPEPALKRVTGIGGIFFKCQDPKAMRAWYSAHLGLNTDQYGTSFEWRPSADSAHKAYTQWSVFGAKTSYFAPSVKDFMINYRVADLDALVQVLRTEGVQVVDTVQRFSYGKFVHILDPEGNKIELWEPYDTEYSKGATGITR